MMSKDQIIILNNLFLFLVLVLFLNVPIPFSSLDNFLSNKDVSPDVFIIVVGHGFDSHVCNAARATDVALDVLV